VGNCGLELQGCISEPTLVERPNAPDLIGQRRLLGVGVSDPGQSNIAPE
jgi:hypothetical protein